MSNIKSVCFNDKQKMDKESREAIIEALEGMLADIKDDKLKIDNLFFVYDHGENLTSFYKYSNAFDMLGHLAFYSTKISLDTYQ